MNKLEVQKRVLQHGKPLDLDKFNWCEETKTFSSSENNLVIDFNGEDYCTLTTGNNCIFTTSSGCTFKTGDYCTFDTSISPQFAITNDEVIKIARVCHEVNKAYCEAIGDKSQKHWGLAEDWQKESSINGVNYFLKNKDCSPEDTHRDWCKQKIADGWSYGKVKDPDNKQHPCLVDYNSLPFEQQVKDQLWVAVVKSYFKK